MQFFRALTLGVAVLLVAAATVSAQVPRVSDGHPDLSGIWQAMGKANGRWEGETLVMNGSQFIQTPDTVAIRYEMIHETITRAKMQQERNNP